MLSSQWDRTKKGKHFLYLYYRCTHTHTHTYTHTLDTGYSQESGFIFNCSHETVTFLHICTHTHTHTHRAQKPRGVLSVIFTVHINYCFVKIFTNSIRTFIGLKGFIWLTVRKHNYKISVLTSRQQPRLYQQNQHSGPMMQTKPELLEAVCSKKHTDSTIQPKYCRLPTGTSCCQTLISAAIMHKVVYNLWVKPNHWEDIMKCQIWGSPAGLGLKKHLKHSETECVCRKQSMTMKRKQTAKQKIIAFVSLYQWKCSFVCLYSRLKLTYFLMALLSCEPCVWTKLISMVYLNRGRGAVGHLVNVYSWWSQGGKFIMV